MKIALEKLGHSGRVFMDLFNRKGGSFPTELSEALKESCNLIVIISSKDCFNLKENGEDWYLREISNALEQGKNIVPVYYDEINNKDIESALVTLENSPYKLKDFLLYQGVFFDRFNPIGSFDQVNSYLKTEEELLHANLKSKEKKLKEQFKLLSEKKNQIHQELLDIKDVNSIECPICHSVNDVTLSYCSNCAFKFFDEVEESVADKNEKIQDKNRIKKHGEIWKGYCEQGNEQVKNMQDTISDLKDKLEESERHRMELELRLSRLTFSNFFFREGESIIVTEPNKKVQFKMIHVEGGTFQMGATPEQGSDAYDDETLHDVTLLDFYIGETQVTQELWNAVMDINNPSEFKGPNLPVECVSMNDCEIFIKKLNKITCGKFRLPTEEEWEYAARGGKKSSHYKYAGSDNIREVAWYDDNSEGHTHEVRLKQSNELGLYDMSGNVREWCSNVKEDNNNSLQSSLQTRSTNMLHVFRGGCWDSQARHCRVSIRYFASADTKQINLGLRLALSST